MGWKWSRHFIKEGVFAQTTKLWSACRRPHPHAMSSFLLSFCQDVDLAWAISSRSRFLSLLPSFCLFSFSLSLCSPFPTLFSFFSIPISTIFLSLLFSTITYNSSLFLSPWFFSLFSLSLSSNRFSSFSFFSLLVLSSPLFFSSLFLIFSLYFLTSFFFPISLSSFFFSLLYFILLLFSPLFFFFFFLFRFFSSPKLGVSLLFWLSGKLGLIHSTKEWMSSFYTQWLASSFSEWDLPPLSLRNGLLAGLDFFPNFIPSDCSEPIRLLIFL